LTNVNISNSPYRWHEFSRENFIFNVTLHGKTNWILSSRVIFAVVKNKLQVNSERNLTLNLILELLQILCLHHFLFLEGVTRHGFGGRMTEVRTVDLFSGLFLVLKTLTVLLDRKKIGRQCGLRVRFSSVVGVRTILVEEGRRGC